MKLLLFSLWVQKRASEKAYMSFAYWFSENPCGVHFATHTYTNTGSLSLSLFVLSVRLICRLIIAIDLKFLNCYYFLFFPCDMSEKKGEGVAKWRETVVIAVFWRVLNVFVVVVAVALLHALNWTTLNLLVLAHTQTEQQSEQDRASERESECEKLLHR